MNPAPRQPDHSTYSGRFAARLRELREKTNMTGQQMAEAIREAGYELGERSYYNWESGKSEPPLDVLPVLAKLFGLSSPRLMLPKE